MDRHGATGLLSFLACATACAALAAGVPAPAKIAPLKSARWIAADADPVRVLTEQPAECFAAPTDPEEAWLAEVGRAVFRSPALLGGQAAKAGIACDSCHRNGRGNPAFSFPGISGAPGTADVTSSLFSSHRGDATDNPKPIPDLGAAGSAPMKVPRTTDTKALESFIRGLIVEEFDGHEPPPAVLRGIAVYVRQVGPAACPALQGQRLGSALAMDNAVRAVQAAKGAIARNDPATALILLESARAMLGQIDERYGAPGLEAERAQLRTSSLDLGSAQSAVRREADAGPLLELWLVRAAGLRKALERTERRSYYEPKVLTALLSAE